MKTKNKVSNLKDLAIRAVLVHAKLENLKAEFKRENRTMDEVIQRLSKLKGKQLKHGNKLIYLVDQFAEKTTVFKATGIRRFQLSVVTKPKGKR